MEPLAEASGNLAVAAGTRWGYVTPQWSRWPKPAETQ
jgi:hypothetical protein